MNVSLLRRPLGSAHEQLSQFAAMPVDFSKANRRKRKLTTETQRHREVKQEKEDSHHGRARLRPSRHVAASPHMTKTNNELLILKNEPQPQKRQDRKNDSPKMPGPNEETRNPGQSLGAPSQRPSSPSFSVPLRLCGKTSSHFSAEYRRAIRSVSAKMVPTVISAPILSGFWSLTNSR